MIIGQPIGLLLILTYSTTSDFSIKAKWSNVADEVPRFKPQKIRVV